MTPPRAFTQGTVIVERNHGGFLMMFPDGTVRWQATKGNVESAARAWFKWRCPKDAIGVGKIEWRD